MLLFPRSIKGRAVAVCAASVVAVAVNVYATHSLQDHLSADLLATRKIATALRNHTIAEMAIGEISNTVLSTILAQDLKAPRQQLDTELAHLAETAAKAVGVIKTLELPDDVRRSLDDSNKMIHEFTALAKSMIELTYNKRPQALAELPQFNSKFKATDESMKKFGSRLDATATAINAQSAEFSARAKWLGMIGNLVTALGMFGLSWFIFGMILRPLSRIQGIMQKLSHDDLDTEGLEIERKDELGIMARTVEVFRQSAIERNRLKESEREASEKELIRQRQMETQIQKFRGEVALVIEQLSVESTKLGQMAGTLSDAATTTSTKAEHAAHASEGAANNSQAVAAATEELGASIREIASQAIKASGIVNETTDKASKSNAEVSGLAEAARKIGSVAEFIRNIADQTNLLALNATIEAARAGEAGKGFAVVANEVKQLAAKTANATQEIAKQIADVQTSTRGAVDSIRDVCGKIGEINGLTGAIAAAVEEQDAATREIAHNVTKAADGSRTAASSVAGLTQTATKTREDAQSLTSATERLAMVSASIKASLDAFQDAVSKDLSDRRKTWRQPVDWKVAIHDNGRRVDSTACDIGLHGMRIHAAGDLRSGKRVDIDFGSGRVKATVTWANQNFAGLEFMTAFSELPTRSHLPGERSLAA